jgi:hypothetical protein
VEGVGGVDKNIEGLYIPMHDAPGVEVEQSREQLLGHPPHLFLAIALSLDPAPLEQLHVRRVTWWRSPLGAYCMRM